jgi:hypothetical protein
MKDRFDLEQEIMSCWTVVEDLKIVAEKYEDDDEISNIMLGLSWVYQMKFEHLFNTFEMCLAEFD